MGLFRDVAATFSHHFASFGTLTAYFFRVGYEGAIDFHAVFVAKYCVELCELAKNADFVFR